MTSKLTREQLHERARENVKALKMASRQTAFESAREEILAGLQLAELALAALSGEPVPVVSADLLHTAASAIEDLLEHTDPNTSYYSGVWADVPGKLRAAMFQAKSLTGNSPVIGIDLASGPDRTVEVRYVAPPGYVMVPKEPTKEMIDAGWLHYMGTKNPSSKGTYKAMLAAAPQSPGSEPATAPGKWIPVSERMPETNKFVLVSNGVWVGQGLYDDSEHLESDEHWQDEHREFINVLHHPVTHWMPLPAAPKQENI
ncbi:Eaa1 [Klebsiella pneumoniae]|nr:Eaa1 [Klebsiella pneumoniae]